MRTTLKTSPVTDAHPATAVGSNPTRSKVAGWIRWGLLLVIVASFFWLLRILPLGRWIEVFGTHVDRMGTWGMAVFALAYILAALLFIPGAALTLAAGALFGLLRGTLVVSVASTAAAALGFLIGRHFARDAVARRAARSPRFAAIDRAIAKGGWRIVGLLRLSPALPYSLGNYLYGLTPVRFVPYVLSSWAAMLPGTFMYVYLGHASRAGLEATGGSRGRSTGEWVLLGVGLLATAVATIYITRLARNAMRDSGDADVIAPTEEASESQDATPKSRSRSTAILAFAAALLVGTAVYASAHRSQLDYLFGPPATTLQESYASAQGTAHIDHSTLNGLLHAHVDDKGQVDYVALAADQKKLDDYLLLLADAPLEELGRDERLALLLNAYNAFTLRLILDHRPIASIRDIPRSQSWDDVRWNIGGNTYSLNQIEHEQIRPNFKEPRVHFALVCAAVGCPPLRNEAYEAEHLEKQLHSQAVYVHTHDLWFQYKAGEPRVGLTQLYNWYGGDFAQVAGSVLDYAAQYAPSLKTAMADERPTVDFLDYDWHLNAQKDRQ